MEKKIKTRKTESNKTKLICGIVIIVCAIIFFVLGGIAANDYASSKDKKSLDLVSAILECIAGGCFLGSGIYFTCKGAIGLKAEKKADKQE